MLFHLVILGLLPLSCISFEVAFTSIFPVKTLLLLVFGADITSKHTDIVALRLPETEDVIDANFITNNVVGYVGAMEPIKHGARLMSEVGSLKVDDSLRGHGVGTILFGRIVQAIQDEGITPYAFCNSDSLLIAKRLNGREIESADEVLASLKNMNCYTIFRQKKIELLQDYLDSSSTLEEEAVDFAVDRKSVV